MEKREKRKGKPMSTDQLDFPNIAKQLTPLIDRIIRGLGVKPSNKTIYGMDYDELFAEALWILYFHILPGFRAKKGELTHYAAVYWSRELRKRLYRIRKHQQVHVPIDAVSESTIRKQYALWDKSLDQCLIRVQLMRMIQTLTRQEILLLSDILKEGRLTPLRDLEGKLGIDHVTLSRIRKRLIRKVLNQM